MPSLGVPVCFVCAHSHRQVEDGQEEVRDSGSTRLALPVSAQQLTGLYLMFQDVFWQLLFADDFSWAASGPNAISNMVLSLFWLVIIGVPISWHKRKGGVEVD
jgi:hypothetical protein